MSGFRLTELEAELFCYEMEREVRDVATMDVSTEKALRRWIKFGKPMAKREVEVETHRYVQTLAAAQAVLLLCPLCFGNKKGPVGVHSVQVTFAGRGVPDNVGTHNSEGRPTRWQVSGTGLSDLTTHPSVWLQGGCGWHGWITNGVAT